MKTPRLVALAWFTAVVVALGIQPPSLSIQNTGNVPIVNVQNPGVTPIVGTAYRLRLESSADLRSWHDEGDWNTLAPDGSGLSVAAEPHRFFRFNAAVVAGEDADGAELFGYRRIFNEELQRVGFLTPMEFATNLPSFGYLDAIGFDPRAAKYWDQFSADFPLNNAEMTVFLTNGFVVSERLGADRFASVYYRILSSDLPVFVTADSVLHAWHFSFERLLEESEETQLAPALLDILNGMGGQLPNLPATVRNGPLASSVADADYYLAVARSLLAGQQVSTQFGGGSDGQVSQTLAAIAAQQYVDDFPLFGANRPVDFSQFIVRGHYTRNPRLARYFQTFMWVSRTDFRLLESPGDPQSLRELGTAAVLASLLQSSGKATEWQELDDFIRTFVGRPEAMSFSQLNSLLSAAGITSLAGITSDTLSNLQARIYNGGYGQQLYAADVFYSPWNTNQVQLPASCSFLGQAFVPDGWAISEVIFDRIFWNEDIPNVTWNQKVLRRYASALDVAYSTLGNRQVGDLIAARMLDASGIGKFRDGYPYAHNLTAAAATFDRLPAAAWQDSLYTCWLAALRALSAPTTAAAFPQAMRTRAWARRALNTQLASYTELKHDTVLYAAQPYAQAILCEYPAGFVEPVPAFWEQMRQMAFAAGQVIQSLSASGTMPVLDAFGLPVFGPNGQPAVVDLAQRKQARLAFCTNFIQQMAALETLATKELQQQPFTDAEVTFIQGLMNDQNRGYLGPTFDGWYPGLFYKDYGQFIAPPQEAQDLNGCNQPDPLVTDIQTAPPDEVDPVGGVLHEATGNVDLLMIAVDNGPDKMVYAGPTLSHYEFILPGPNLQRLTDDQWKTSTWPARPPWTTSYLVPK
ncbi:MAG: DUF3160 domain-containing protein [Verrucomicrobiota bacterium]|jgi:hypothetical protein